MAWRSLLDAAPLWRFRCGLDAEVKVDPDIVDWSIKLAMSSLGLPARDEAVEGISSASRCSAFPDLSTISDAGSRCERTGEYIDVILSGDNIKESTFDPCGDMIALLSGALVFLVWTISGLIHVASGGGGGIDWGSTLSLTSETYSSSAFSPHSVPSIDSSSSPSSSSSSYSSPSSTSSSSSSTSMT